MRRRTVILSLALAFIVNACSSDDGTTAVSPDTTIEAPSSTVRRIPIAELSASSTIVRGLLTQPIILTICDKGFCADFPTDGDPVQRKLILQDGDKDGIYISAISVDQTNGKICPDIFSDNSLCNRFAHEIYEVIIVRYPDRAFDDVLAMVRKDMLDSNYRDVRQGTFMGKPAIFSTFHTPLGGSGPFIDVWHNGAVYSIWAGGLITTTPHFADAFLASFRFTD